MVGYAAEQPGLVKRCIREGANRLRMFLRLPMPIDALPPEVLSQVFEYLPPTSQKMDLIRITHVCKRWRASATGNAALWTAFQIHSFDGVQEFLRRSGSLPLSLYLAKGPLDQRVPRIVAGVADRIRLIHVTVPAMEDIESLLAEPTIASPPSQVLHIEHMPQNMTADPERRWSLVPLFNREVPALQSFAILPLPLPLTPPHTLRHFYLGGCNLDPLPHIHSLFDMLQACTLLETLTIKGQHAPTFSMEHHTRSVVLPKMNFLRLALQPANITGQVLMAFVLPAHVHISLATELDGDLVFDDILSRTYYPLPKPFEDQRPQSMPRSVAPPLRRLHLAWNATHQLLRAYRDPGPEDDTLSATGIPAIEIDCRQPQIVDWSLGSLQDERQWVSFISGWRFDASRVETLILECEPGAKRRDTGLGLFYSTLQRLPELRTICVVGLAGIKVSMMMEDITGWRMDDGVPIVPCLCPKLSTLELREVDMKLDYLPHLKTALNVHFLEHADGHDEAWKITLKMVRCGGWRLKLWGKQNETPNVRICVEGSASLRPWDCVVS